MEKRYGNIVDAAQRLGISQKAAWARLYRGQLPYRRWGKRILIPLDELDRFIAALPGASASEAAAKSAAAR